MDNKCKGNVTRAGLIRAAQLVLVFSCCFAWISSARASGTGGENGDPQGLRTGNRFDLERKDMAGDQKVKKVMASTDWTQSTDWMTYKQWLHHEDFNGYLEYMKEHNPEELARYKDWSKKQNDSTGQTEPLAATLADAVGQNRIAINIVWTLITGFLVMFMQAGFALVESGLCRARNAAHVFMTNLMVYPISVLGFWAFGFAFMFGGMGDAPAQLGGIDALKGPDWHGLGLIGNHGFFLKAEFYDVGVFTMFLFQSVFMDTMATIPTGAMAERWRFSAFAVYAFVVSSFIYPIYGHWVWGGGWLSQLGLTRGLGHGALDFAGSGVVHAIGGVTAFVGALMLGPRLGRFAKCKNNDELVARERKFRPHSLPLAMLGTLILAFGWFGFNPGSTLGASGGGALRIGVIATNTMLASAGGAVSAMAYWWYYYKKPEPSICANGMLSGLVAITAPCAFVNSLWAVVIGLVAGWLMCLTTQLLLKLRIDDPVGAVAVHGTCGIWGVFALGIFADGTYGYKFNGVEGFVRGAICGDLGQLWAQCISIVMLIVWAGVTSAMLFGAQRLFKRLRSRRRDEYIGLDITELGVLSYVFDHGDERKSGRSRRELSAASGDTING